MGLNIRTSAGGVRHTLVLKGELDVASAPVLESALMDICAIPPSELVVDMGGVEFVDSAGFNAILRARALCEENNCAFSLTPSQRPVQRSFEGMRLLNRLRSRRVRPHAHPH
ncbi:MAG TPA: STAS domain-containing protein [Solirubrobacteraceae bacterium]|jgi:anti-anti-sigma factor